MPEHPQILQITFPSSRLLISPTKRCMYFVFLNQEMKHLQEKEDETFHLITTTISFAEVQTPIKTAY